MIICPKKISGYVIDSNEKRKYINKIIKFIKKKKLPKGLEVSIIEDVLEILKEKPEHEYKKKYDVFGSEHPYFD